MSGRFEKRTVVVTGAGSGIGAACVARLRAEGAQVVAVDVSTAAPEPAEAAGPVVHAALDVRDRAAAVAFMADLRSRHGALHGLVNCAGIKGVGSILELETDGFREVMAVNLEGTLNMCQAFVLAVRDDPGPRAIVNVSSGAGLLGVPNRLPYVASKFGVSGITRSMAPELGPLGIRVNAVAPGMTRTPFTEYMTRDEAAVARINAAHPIGRMGEPAEIAAVIVFLLTDDASFMTGAVVPVDGGQTACL